MPAVSAFRSSARSGPRSTRYVEKPGPYGYRKEKVEPNYNNFNRQTRSSTIGFADTKSEAVREIDRFDSVVGFDRCESGPKKTGWLVNFHTTTIPSEEVLQGLVGVDYYFLDEEGGSFKVTMSYDPYFLVKCQVGTESEVEEYLRKFLESIVKKVEQISKEDLRQPNHLLGIERKLLKLSFHNITDLLEARRMLRPIVDRNERSKEGMDIYKSVNLNYSTMLKEDTHEEMKDTHHSDPSELIEELREYDVPYHSRVSIDKDIRVGKWYDVEADNDHVVLTERKDKIAFADPVVLAFDIETTKAPLKFPDSAIDQVMMISYMIDGDGYLITNRDIISEDIMDFEYTPRPEYPGSFTIFNEINEKALLERFFEHIREVRPTVIATFNGDFFDWPFVEARAAYHGIDMHHEIGFAKDSEDEYKSSYCSHMDCFRWVKRDSYLPQGAQGLKAVTTAKLGYNPTELDPELMTPYAYEKPQTLAEYSVSDAVATYYLYYKYVHPFIFSLCTIIPLNPDEVLRKGTGTLCEVLLTVQAYTHGIVLPNKHTDPLERFYEGHLIESETYVGGHVESLEAGVFRADLDTDFKIDPTAVDLLLDDLEGALKFAITEEDHQKLEDVTNFEEVHQEVKRQLLAFKEHTKIREPPVIYHVDVSSMYPNIMISNRLQPDSMKSEEDCAACDFNRPGKKCDRRLSWAWRGEFYPADMSDYSMMKNAMQNESFPPRKPGMPNRTFSELSYAEQTSYLKKHVSDYSRKVYHRIKQSEIVEREAIICQRENPFYVNTVRSFRDRRYEFKGLAKLWKKKLHQVNKDDKHALDEAKKLAVLYDSMQLAHKVILNSFYGYVMRKGSRWYSMEMAGVTCLTGATIIQMARALIGRLGRPLELDTDGIWCALPKSFPDTFTFNLKNGKSISTTYPCSMLNYIVHKRFTNDQYQMLVDPEKMRYETHSENTIFFEADGPYKAMILPTSKEEGKGLKKRYAVFNFDGTLAELKGFELKRRGELQLIKNFQSDIFKLFLDGSTLEECYDTVATVANRWLDVLETHGKMLEDEDLIELICQNRSMSKALEDYGNQKSTSITTARRLGEFLGEEMVKDKGLACKYIVADRPLDAPVTERAIPTAIFSSELSVKRKYLRRWLKDPSLEDFDPRSIIDWDYYRERLASVIQKIITIPAALQGVANPVPRVAHPDWMQKRIDTMSDKMKQSSLTSFFTKAPAGSKPVMPSVPEEVQDIEDIGEVSSSGVPKVARVVSRRKRRLGEKESELEIEQQILRQPMPDPAVDYVSFLNYEKVKWNMQAKERERRQKLFGRSFQMTTDKGAVEGYLQRRAETYATSLWQVIQYQADPAHPGDLQVFALIGGKIQSLTLHIEKKIYVKFKSGNLPDGSIENCELSRSVESLPTGGDSENLFKLVMPEQVYIEELNKVDSVLKSTSVAGVYESYISAEDRAIMDLGTCLKFDDKKMNLLAKSFENGFNQKNLKPMPAEGYLQRFSMGILYLLHIISNGYEIFTLFNSTDPTAYMYVLKASSTAQQLPPKMGAYYRDIFKAKKPELGKYYSIIDYPSEISFETHYFSDIGKLHRKLNARIAALNERSASKFLFAIQSPYPANLRRVFKASSSMPTVTMNIGEIQVSALSWHGLIMKRIVNHYLSLSSWIKKLMGLSRYSNIPLCNLKVDNMGYLIDIEYARRLTTAGIILWWSPTPTPDYGGSEKDRALFEADDSLQFPHFNSPEAYDTVCLEVDVKNLTINTVLTSSFINEAEGVFISESGENKGTEDSEAATFADDSFSGPALAVLRGLARHWWDDAIKDNAEADSMVHGFISWYSNPGSFMYDSSLHYHVHNLTKKSFVQLLGEFKRLGAGIVFADRNKIILKTTKTVVENSYAYGQYLVSSVRSKPLFNLLELKISRYWDMLVWMDKYNHAGSFCDEILGEDEQKLDYMSKWQIRQYLPIIMQGEFDDWVILFLDALIKDREREYQSSGQTQNSPRRTQITQILKQHKFNGAVIDMDSIEHGVCEYFRNPLLKRVKTLIRKQNEMQLDPAMRQEFEFPKLAGSHLNLTNPALELVKDLCQILSVSKRRNLEVRMLRKELLSLFEVKEFSEEGIFKNPSASLIIPQVICDYCDFTKDIDVCRDDEKDIFHCDSCHRAYNKLIIEEKLIYELERTVTKYLTQDLKCNRCGRMKDREISLHCPCSGDWISTISRSKMLTRIRIFQNVAEAYRFKLLRDITEEFI
ncbi:DEKNAAC101151 [Brettanomyces naardenensis]|uniref:DNA polymerase epsilon catalytic subunit n=1 Tax=Brettanomyces naardenensis TaxID=13370 RepID=A0A448YHF4_BRENA|nr:DEKNAAC101151 [Brettanomyces naardenensis]